MKFIHRLAWVLLVGTPLATIATVSRLTAQPYRAAAEHREPDPSPLPIWDPGFGPHAQVAPPKDREARIREILACEDTALVCCDPCGMCVCERERVGCPDIMLMGRRHCETP